MADLITMLSACGATEGEATDAEFQNTVLLLHGDGTNGAQNNTFLDSSTNNFTITRNGNTTQGSFSPFSKPDGAWGNYFDGSGDYLSLANNAAFAIESGNFTVETWVYRTASGAEQYLFSRRDLGGWEFRINATNLVQFFFTGGSSITSSATIPVNAWAHLAVTRETNTVRLFINGALDSSATFSNGGTATASLFIGYGTTGGGYFTGYMSNARIVKGTAVYTSAFTPNTSPLTAIANTSLLTCQSNRFIDNSTNNFTITPNGDVKVTPFSPFPITTAYDPAVNGGSGYFDGSGDKLSAPTSSDFDFGTGDFTIEGWMYLTSASGNYQSIWLMPHTNGFVIVRFGNSGSYNSLFQVAIVASAANNVYSTSRTQASLLNQWVHFAFTRSGTTCRVFINGTQENLNSGTNPVTFPNTSFTDSTDITSSTAPDIGNDSTPNPFNGYIADLRVLKGTAQYTSSFTPPTAPLSVITNTELLLNFTNAGIFDNTGFNNLETVGNAQIDTSVKKFGTGSMYFDGTGDYLTLTGNPTDFAFGTGDFTIEMWLYANSVSNSVFYDGRPAGTNGAYPMLYFASGILRYFANSADRITSGTAVLSTSTWYHIALCRSGTDTKLFLDGVQIGSTYTDSTNYLNTGNRPWIGVNANSTNTSYLNGYIDDLRITKGIARYTTAFTPPTAAFPDVGE